ncbi:MAG: hypothetical protein KKE79_04130, partial [Actinobacteria bacterium]|nr:hypothetical protein [Actinomycetota bacterium]
MKKRLLIVGICIAVALLVLGLIGVFSSLGAYREMKAAKDQLFSAVESLEKGDLEPAAAGFAEAQNHVEKADSKLGSRKVSTGFLETIPYAGTQVKALDRFIQIADHLSKAGIMATEAFREVPGLDESLPQGRVSIGTMVDILPKL